MLRLILLVALILALPLLASAAEIYYETDFEGSNPQVPAGKLQTLPERGQVLHITVPPSATPAGDNLTIPLPIEKLRGKIVFFGADVKGQSISAKPNPWNGIKVMMVINVGGKMDYPQPEIPVGDFDWKRFTTSVAIPEDATSANLVLGLEQVSGQAWFDRVRVSLRKPIVAGKAAPADQPIYRGHDLARLRGAMVHPSMTEEDLRFFAQTWKGNLIRWQLIQSSPKDPSIDDYDQWLDGQLKKLDEVLGWCDNLGVKLVVDMHSPPGGQAFEAGYVTARGRIFTEPAAQAKFIEAWKTIAQRYKGRQIIWGFDLMNEADDVILAEGCVDWNELAGRAAKAIHAIDPHRTIIVEPNGWGGAGGFVGFLPLDEPRVVYSYHMYEPHQFTHQGVFKKSDPVTYPGVIDGKMWDTAQLEAVMKPAIDFADRYRVHMYVGEFSAIRTAPGDSAANYLADVTNLFEKLGYDWSYHAYREWQGWSLEHESPSLQEPTKASHPTTRQKVITGWYEKNTRP